MTAKHTPGKWRVWRDMDQKEPVQIVDASVDGICVIDGLNTNATANALLISAAPEMLSVLRECLTLLEDPDAGEVEAGIVEARIREVLARAEGGGL